MKIKLELTEEEAHLIHTFIRRSIYEQYLRNMTEANDTQEEAENRVYKTVSAMHRIKSAIEKANKKNEGHL